MCNTCLRNDIIRLEYVRNFSIFDGFFCCNPDVNDDLDDFIHKDAEQHYRDRMAVTYAAFLSDNSFNYPIGFATLQNDVLRIKHKEYRYNTSPAVKIGIFGVRIEYQRIGIGTNMLSIIKDFVFSQDKIDCRYLTLDAYNNPTTLNFYTNKNGFKFLKEPNPQRKQEILFFDLLYH